MKNKIYKLVGVVAIVMIAFVYNMKNENTKDQSLVNLAAMHIAMAEPGESDPDGDSCSKEDNASCYVSNELSISGCDEDTWYSLSDCY